MYGFDSRGIRAEKYKETDVPGILEFLNKQYPNEGFTLIERQ
jgi:hypothetical protein